MVQGDQVISGKGKGKGLSRLIGFRGQGDEGEIGGGSIRSVAMAPVLGRAHRFSLNSSQLESCI
jgi:hypothetical protein